MHYDEFRNRLLEALDKVGLLTRNLGRPTETIDLANTERCWQVYIWQSSQHNVEPFHVSAKISFSWNPINAARAYTCEEDLLTELLGKKQRLMKTEQRWTRVDLTLYATLPYGSTTALPDPQTLGLWANSVSEKLGKLFTEIKERQGRVIAVIGSREDVKIEAQCDAEGEISLQGVSVSGFRIVRVPRIWDDPDRGQAEKSIEKELDGLARRFEAALEEWTRGVAELAKWIHYAPPPPEKKQVELQFEDEEQDTEEEPETIH